MSRKFKVVDLFAGPGGLAEGFASVQDDSGENPFRITLSIEKESFAFDTLRLRSFFRQFDTAPQTYYDYIAGKTSKDRLKAEHQVEWDAAIAETYKLELGTKEASAQIDPILDSLRDDHQETVLIGGPPCQAYSLAGRSRNKGIADYDAAQDTRHFLYKEYIRIIERLQPAAFVMENVKGILSSKVSGEAIFDKILSDLASAGGDQNSYTLMPITSGDDRRGNEFLVRSEDYGVPQCRHRVIIVGIRSDLTTGSAMGIKGQGLLEPTIKRTTVADVLEGMPKLRSGLSKVKDGEETWRNVVVNSIRAAANASRSSKTISSNIADRLDKTATKIEKQKRIPSRCARRLTAPRHNILGEWLSDPNLDFLPNHETRGHIESDLARYAFASVFAEVIERSPKASEFPIALAPAHSNWSSGIFADRFRVQPWGRPSTTVTSHISKDGHYFIHPDPEQCRSLTVREAARLQTFPDNYFFEGARTHQFIQVGNAVPPYLAHQIADSLHLLLLHQCRLKK